MNINMTKSMMVSDYKQTFDWTQFKGTCRTNKIILNSLGQMQFQSAYALQGFKVIHEVSQKYCFIFIAILKEGSFKVSGYVDGALISEDTCDHENRILDIIHKCLNSKSVKSISKAYDEGSESMQKMFNRLHKKSEQIMKKSNNEMMAIQEIKSSQEYMQICSFIKTLSLQVSELCKTVKARKNIADSRISDFVQKLLEIQKLKQVIENENMKFEEAKNGINNVEGLLDQFIRKKRQEFEEKDFYDEDSFTRYLETLVGLKRMENQKRFLSK